MAEKHKSRLRVLIVILALIFLLAALVVGYSYYDSHVDRSGWVMQYDQYYYRVFHNKNVTGWQDIEGSRYFFDEEGVMQTGWLEQ